MKHFCTFIVVLILGFAPFSVYGQSAADKKQQLVDEVVETLALSHRVAGLPANLARQFEQNPFRLPEQVNKKWLSAFKKAYSEAQLVQDYRSILKDKLSELKVEEIQNWLNKPSTKKLAKARQEHYSLQGKRKQIVALYELEQDSPAQKRQELLSAFAEAMIPANALIESSVIVFKSVINSIDEFSSRLNFTETQMSMLITNFRQEEPNHIQQIKEKGLPVKFYGVPSKTIEQSLDFWQTETGQALTEAIYSSLQKTYAKAAQRLSESVNADSG